MKRLKISPLKMDMSLNKGRVGSKKGASLIEYGMVVGLVSVLAIGAVYSTGTNVRSIFDTTTAELDVLSTQFSNQREAGQEDVGPDPVPAPPEVVPNTSPQISTTSSNFGRFVVHDGIAAGTSVATYDIVDADGDDLTVALTRGSADFEIVQNGAVMDVRTTRLLAPGSTFDFEVAVDDATAQDTTSGEIVLVAYSGIQNAGFETVSASATALDRGHQDTVVPDWSTNEATLYEWINDEFRATHSVPIVPYEGTYALDISNSEADDQANGAGEISQEIEVELGRSYELSLWAADWWHEPDAATAEVYINDTFVGQVDPPAWRTWENYTYQIDPVEDGIVDIRIVASGLTNGTSGLLIDAMTLEPTTP